MEKTSTTINGAVYRSVESLASEIGLSRASTYTGLNNGTIPSIRIGKRFVLPKAAISKWLESAGRKAA